MAWFDFIEEQGLFDPDHNPAPQKVEDGGYQIPFWEVLSYLEKLSNEIAGGRHLEYADKIVGIIQAVSENPKDNRRTWYMFIKILCKLPNEKVSIEVLNYIPVWLSGQFDTMLQTSEIVEKLLPKFLPETPTDQDITKAELILNHLFHIEIPELKEGAAWNEKREKIQSTVYLHFLANIVKGDLIKRIASHCSNSVLKNLGRSLKKILIHEVGVIYSKILNDEQMFEIKAVIGEEDVTLYCRKENDNSSIQSKLVTGYESLNQETLKSKIIEGLAELGVTYEPSESPGDLFFGLNFSINNDLMSLMGRAPIGELNELDTRSDELTHTFALIFRDLLLETVKLDSESGYKLLLKFFFDKKFGTIFFKRSVLFVIAFTWDESKRLFWELVNSQDPRHLFSQHAFHKDMYALLRKVGNQLTEGEKTTISAIIEIGPQGEALDDNTTDKQLLYWKQRWYAALKDISPFREAYQQLIEDIEVDDVHYEQLGKVQISSGWESPFSVDEIISMDIQALVEKILELKTTNSWDGPDAEGLARAVGGAVRAEPKRFSKEINQFGNVYYVYAYHILHGFRDAWEDGTNFDWDKVLDFCNSYIGHANFYTGQYEIEPGKSRATPEWVVGAAANLLSTGTQKDQHAFDLELLPKVKKLLQIIIPNLEVKDDLERTNMDHPTYSLNSTAGKSLRALFDYSLRLARNNFKFEDSGKWELETQKLYENSIEKGIIDSFILIGLYFEQFYFLDKDWVSHKIESFYDLDDHKWLAFMNGFGSGRPPFNKELYNLFKPHYERAIEHKIVISTFYDHGLIRHMVAFYLWSFEDLTEDSTIHKFISTSTPERVHELVRFVSRQKDYSKGLTSQKLEQFHSKITNLWKRIAELYDDPKSEEERMVTASLPCLLKLLPELTEQTSAQIVNSVKYISEFRNTHELFEDLIDKLPVGDTKKTAKYVGEILLSLDFRSYFGRYESQNITQLVQFLYENGQKSAADTLCNKISSLGHDFLKETYLHFNTPI